VVAIIESQFGQTRIARERPFSGAVVHKIAPRAAAHEDRCRSRHDAHETIIDPYRIKSAGADIFRR